MSKRAWWLGTLAALAIGPVIAAGAFVALLDPNAYKPEIIQAVQDATGRTLSLDGPVRLRRSLWPAIELTNVMLANAPGGSRADMARVERIEAEMSLPALLRHRIEVIKLTLIGPNILFEQVANQPNWVFTAPPRAQTGPSAPPETPPAAASGKPYELSIRNIVVRNGMVTWRFPARTKVLGIRSLDVTRQRADGPFELDATLVYSDNHPFSLKASAQPLGSVTEPWTTRLAFAALGTRAVAEGTMDLAGGYDLKLEATAEALEKLNALLPEMHLPALRQATLATHIKNGPALGALPVLGETKLHVAEADLHERIPGLRTGAVLVSLPAAGGLATVSATGHYRDQPFTLTGTVGVPAHPDGQNTVPIDLTLQAAPSGGTGVTGTLGLKGKLTLDALGFHGLDAAAALRTPALASLRPLISPALPALTDVELDARFVLPPTLASITFHAAKLSSRQGDLSGDGVLVPGANLAVESRLRSQSLDLDAMLAAFGFGTANAATAPGPAGPVIPGTPLPWAALRGATLDLAADIGAVTLQGHTWRNVGLALRLKEGQIQTGTVKLAFPAGPFELAIVSGAPAGAVPVSLSLHAPGVPLELLAHAAGMPGPVSGVAKLDMRLRASGRSLRDLAASLEGPFSMSVAGGRLSNQAFIKLASVSLDALGITVPAEGESAIRCLNLAGSFAKGVGTVGTVALDTTYLAVTGAGRVDLGQETLAFDLHPLAQVSGSEVSVPVVVAGPFRDISGKLDASGLEKLGLFVDGLFGGDKREPCAAGGRDHTSR